MSLRLKKAVKSMKYKSECINIKCKRTDKKIEFMRIKHMKMQHMIIRLKMINKQTKLKRLCRKIKHIRKNKIVIHMSMT